MIQPQPLGKVSSSLIEELHQQHPKWTARFVHFLAAYMEAATNEGVMFFAANVTYPEAHMMLKSCSIFHFTSLPVNLVSLDDTLALTDPDGMTYVTGDRSTVGTLKAYLTTARV